MTIDYLVQQVDGTSRFTLQDGSGFILLQSSTVVVVRQETDITVFIPSTQDIPIQLNDKEDISLIT